MGLSALATPIMVLVLPTQREDALAAGPHLQVLGIALIFICLMILTNAILQTYGRERIPIFTVIAGGVVKVVMNYILVGNPDINIHGAPISTLCCYMVIVGLNLYFVWKYSPQKPRYPQPVRQARRRIRAHGDRRLGGVRVCLTASSSAAATPISPSPHPPCWASVPAWAVYGVLVIALRILRAEDVRSIPHGEKLIKLLHLK